MAWSIALLHSKLYMHSVAWKYSSPKRSIMFGLLVKLYYLLTMYKIIIISDHRGVHDISRWSNTRAQLVKKRMDI